MFFKHVAAFAALATLSASITTTLVAVGTGIGIGIYAGKRVAEKLVVLEQK